MRPVRPVTLIAGIALILGVGVAVASWRELAGVGLAPVLTLLPALIGLHLFQLLVGAAAWRALLPPRHPPLAMLWRLRIIREGIDSLLPVAQVGGEVVGARLLARAVPATEAAASVIVDLAVEFLTLIIFLGAGLLTLFELSGHAPARPWVVLAAVAVGLAASAAAASRLGLLRGIEALLKAIARRTPMLAGFTLDGLNAAALATWRRRRGLAIGVALHVPAWALGCIESWLVLRALGHPSGAGQALVVESLGMAGRCAGFAIPAALGAQEGGFVLAVAAIGIAAGPGIALSLVKRLREVLVGLIGLALWQLEAAR